MLFILKLMIISISVQYNLQFNCNTIYSLISIYFIQTKLFLGIISYLCIQNGLRPLAAFLTAHA